MIEVVAIGTELVLGETADINTAWIARRLASAGYRLNRAAAVSDDPEAIRDAVTAALRRSGTVICTGGLGPTADDLTRDVVAGLYGRAQRVDEAWLTELRRRYALRRVQMPAINRVQALVPEGADLLPNARGTAPGIALHDESLGTTFLLPGVPAEMRGMFDAEVLPRLVHRLTPARPVRSRVIRTTGIPESAIAERIADVVTDTAPLTLAFLPGVGGVDLRLTDWGSADANVADAAFDRVVGAVRERLGIFVFAEGDVDLASVVGAALRRRGLRIALAESCTGGLVAKMLTDGAGASDYMMAGLVTYSNEAKTDVLGVNRATLREHGAVSEACVREMAEGALRVGHADVALAVTGIAGPGGGTPEKPVGLVWFGLAIVPTLAGEVGQEPVTARSIVLAGDRGEVRERAAYAGLDTIRRTLGGSGAGG